MNKGLIGLLSLMLVAVITGCGGGAAPEEEVAKPMSKEQKKEAEGSGAVSVAPAPAEAPVEAPAEAATPAPEAPAAPAEAMEAKTEAPAGVDGLVGTTWKYDEIDLTFQEGNKVFLKGGPLAAIAPDGQEATYTLGADGAFEVSVLGQTYGGTFDGTKLVVDGKDAVKQKHPNEYLATRRAPLIGVARFFHVVENRVTFRGPISSATSAYHGPVAVFPTGRLFRPTCTWGPYFLSSPAGSYNTRLHCL